MRAWLKDLRTKNGYTMKVLGSKLGISESYYCAIESGDRQKKMDLSLASAIANVFCIPIEQVAEMDNQSDAS